jgi:hypothetical protein
MEDVPSPPDSPAEPSREDSSREPSRPGPAHPAGPGESRPDPDHGTLLGAGAIGFLTLGVAVAASLAIGGVLGYLVDEWAGTSPLFTLVGLAFGIVIATLMTITRVRKYL